MKLKNLLTLLLVALCINMAWAKQKNNENSYNITRGMEELGIGNYADANSWFEKELAENPKNGYAHLYIGALRGVLQDYGLALSSLDKALQYIPKKDKENRALTYSTRARVNLAMEDTISAINDYALAISTDPTDRDYYEKRGQLYFELGNYDLSDKDYNEMIKLDRGDTMGYMGIGRNARDRKNYDEAIAQFSYAAKLAPDYSSAYSFRAEAYGLQGKWKESIDDIIKALGIDGDQKAFLLLHDIPAEHSLLAKSKLKSKMLSAPNDRYWPYCLGSFLEHNGEYEEAISYYLKGNDIDADPTFFNNIARCYKKMGDFDHALEMIDKAIAMDPNDADYMDLKASILMRSGKNEECIAELDKIIELDPGQSLSYFQKAESLMNMQKYNEAIELYTLVEDLNPDLDSDKYLHLKKADAYRLMGKNADAEKEYRKVLTLSDSTGEDSFWTIYALTGLKDFNEAEKALNELQYKDDESLGDLASFNYNKACLYARMGKNKEAMEYLNSALENNYDDVGILNVDYDLDGLRREKGFNELISKYTKIANPVKKETTTTVTKERVEVPFTKESGVTKVKCSINDLPLHFVFDTGASDVTISMVEANFMLKNDYIKSNDIIGSRYYMDANGDISEGTIINLRKVNFGGMELDNVRASVVRNQKAPLLLGQSVLGRLGKVEIDNGNQKIIISR